MTGEAPLAERCVTIAELDAVLQMDAASPRRLHVEECPRCRALLAVYREFLEDRYVPPGADVADAATRLRASFVDALRESRIEESTGLAERPRRAAHLARLVLRPAWIAASLFLVVAGIYGGYEILRDRGGPSRLRGAPGHEGRESAGSPALIESRLHADGSLELRWRRVAGVDSYEVRVFGPDLMVAGRFGSGIDTALVLSADQLRACLPERGPAGLQVVGRRAGHEIARSTIATVELR